MKLFKYAILPAAIALVSSCTDIDDVYQYDDNSADTDWNEVADQSTAALVDYFWNADRGYFNEQSGVSSGDGWNYWSQAHAMDVVIDAYRRKPSDTYRAMMDSWYDGIRHQSGGSYFNDFYDDEAWITLTMIRLYEVTSDKKFLDTARMLWDDIKAGWNTEYCDGGLAWKHSQPWSKNACINAPGCLIACRLYSIEKLDDDLAWAKKIYDWARGYLFNPATGAVYDNIDGSSGNMGTFSLSYNQGTFMASAHYLYQFTSDPIYLKDARRAANYCISTGCVDAGNNVIRDEGDGDGALFKGIFMRYFTDMLGEPALDESIRNKFVTFFRNNAEVAWSKGIADKRQILFGPNWTVGPQGATNLNAQTSGCTMMEARARFENSLK